MADALLLDGELAGKGGLARAGELLGTRSVSKEE